MTEHVELAEGWEGTLWQKTGRVPVGSGKRDDTFEDIRDWLRSLRPAPVQVGGITADGMTPGDRVEFDAGGETYTGEVMPPKHDEYGPSWTWVDTGRGPLGIFIVPNGDLRPASPSTAESAEESQR